MARAPSHRLQWAGVALHVQEWVSQTLGSPVVQAEGQQGGYGPGMAARCALADGRRYFVKAVSPAQNPDTPEMMRGEAQINAVLPENVPAPKLLHRFDDGKWVVLVFEDVAGRQPGEPWTEEDLRRVADASHSVAGSIPHPSLPTTADRYRRMFTGWRTLAPEQVSDLWCRRHLTALAGLESRWEECVSGESLVHGDLRSDNILISPPGAVFFVDWTSTSRGAEWFDLVTMLPSIEVAGGGQPEEVLEAFGLDLDPQILTPLVAAFAGYFTHRARLPDPPGLPTVRDFQRRQGGVTVAWLRRLVGWD